MEPAYEELLKRVAALESQLSAGQLVLCDGDGHVRARLSGVDGLQLLDTHGTVRAQLKVDDHSTCLEMSTPEGARIELHTGGSETTVQFASQRMHWYLGLFESEQLAIQRMADTQGQARITSEIHREWSTLTVRSDQDEWVWIRVVGDHPGELLIKNGPEQVWSAPDLTNKVLAYGTHSVHIHHTEAEVAADVPEAEG